MIDVQDDANGSMAQLLHSSKYVIDDGQRDHSLPLSLHVIEHVLVVDHPQGGVQLGRVLHLLPLDLLLVLELVLLVLRQLGVENPGPIVPDVAVVRDVGHRDISFTGLVSVYPSEYVPTSSICKAFLQEVATSFKIRRNLFNCIPVSFSF